MKKSPFFITFLMFISLALFGQVGINTDNSLPDNSAMLDVKSVSKGFLPPRMTQAEMSTILNPAEGLMVYCTDCGLNGTGVVVVFMNGAWSTLAVNCILPAAPAAGVQVPSPFQIIWNWNTVSGATGYKWGTTNMYSSATDMGTATTTTETGLTCNAAYTRYAWAYNACGNSFPLTMNQATSLCPFSCGSPVTINHVAGTVAPVTKTVTYGTVTNIPGEPLKCWITSNLGSDHQATAVDDSTEASAGWYWQFNRKQGYKHDGTTRTPNTPWITYIGEFSDWQPADDPCTLEMAGTWHIPTWTELNNVNIAGGWIDWYGSWNSGLKLHAAGLIWNDLLYERGSFGAYVSSSHYSYIASWYLQITIGSSVMGPSNKRDGLPVRCIRDN
jgi:hypothetical protein